jgi:CubicO group peptidase (beta-lactamase class C family)
MPKLHGTCDSRFAALEKSIQANIDSGLESGVSVVVNIKGENVVDLWGGWADAAKTREWEENTIVNVWSSSKTVLSLAALVLVERGLLDPHEKVSKYWPEFAANGKENVEVRHFLSHSSGVSGWEEKLAVEDFADTAKTTAALAAQAPWWTPGTASGYHSMTMGFLVGELVRRTTGKSLKQFIREDVCAPLGADFQLGATEADTHRVAEQIAPPPADMTATAALMGSPPLFVKTLLNPQMDATVANTPMWRAAEVGAGNGHTNARGIARVLSVIPNGGTVDGVKLLSPETIALIFKEQTFGPDQVMGIPIRFGLGFGLPGKDTAIASIPEGKVCFWGGWGGSMAIMDVERGVTITYMMNKMAQGVLGSETSWQYIRDVYEALGVAL